ncbi:hypothetical protein G6011_02440 [Alternaria panax]|uniref:Uncharacterized protein n=1 Tax=Alternaria panax TaxID=48097 RepID=A0AAD4I7D6_9PLEO|nr:hypothetical protein G6011_02440 [Alternaria panax]
MFSKTIIIAAATFLLGVNAQAKQAKVCSDANLGGRCEFIDNNNICKNIQKDWASSYDTNGLTCTFYDNNNCFVPVIGPTNGRNGNLRNGEFNDQINSVQCK